MKDRKTWWNTGLGGALCLALLFAFCLILPAMTARAVESSVAVTESKTSSKSTKNTKSTKTTKTTDSSQSASEAEDGTETVPETEKETEPETETPEKKEPFAQLFLPYAYDDITKDQKLVIVEQPTVNIRKGAGMEYDVIAIARKDQVIKQIGARKAADGSQWYKVQAVGEEESASGYIAATMCRSVTLSAKGDIYANYLRLMGFPDSYIPGLKALHAQYPNWLFKATDTGLDWWTSLYEEANPPHHLGIALIHNYTWPNSYKSLKHDNFDFWANNFKGIYDGPAWTLASDNLVAYYLDPRNFLKEDGIFQFLNLLYDDNQTVAGVRSIVQGTFMEDGAHIYGEPFSYPELLHEVGKELGVSPYYLAASIKQEIGLDGSSKSIHGKSSTVSPGGIPLKGYYNYYNVYAYTMMGMDANDVGLWFAEGQDNGNTDYNRPWNTRTKAIKGGAMYHAYNYLLVGQHTLYYKRFNVANGIYWHQYMTNIMGAYSESRHLSLAYDSLARKQVLRFDIPVYQNMPETPSPQPSWDENAKENLNPNNRLASLTATNTVKNPTVTVDGTQYKLAVDRSQIRLEAIPVDGGAWVQGAGDLTLEDGENIIPLTVVAANGDSREYSISIFNGQQESLVFTTDCRHVKGGYWWGIPPGTRAKDFGKLLELAEGASVKLLNVNGKSKSGDELVKTGDRVRIYAPGGALYFTGICLIYGDVDGNGEIDIFDLVRVRNHIIHIQGAELSGRAFRAADVNRDGTVDIFDLVGIRNSIIRYAEIEQQ